MENTISLSQAAKQFSISKNTISKAIKEGRLKIKGKTHNGGYKIDIADFEYWRKTVYKNPAKPLFTELDLPPKENRLVTGNK